jgi:hypothetical protein
VYIFNLGDIATTLLISDRSDYDDRGYFSLVFWISIWTKPRMFAVIEFSLVDLPENLEKFYQKLHSTFMLVKTERRALLL